MSPSDDVSRLIALNSLDKVSEKSKDYVIGPGDVLEVSIFEWELREETKTATFRVAESGVIALPVIGELEVGGKTVRAVKKDLENTLKRGRFIKDPKVSIDIAEFRSKRVAVIGAVRDPGVYTLRQNVTTFLDIVSLAGGLSEQAGYEAYVIRSGGFARSKVSDEDRVLAKGKTYDGNDSITIDMYELLEEGNLDLNMVIDGDDIINIPEAQSFSVIGYVRGPGKFPLRKPMTVLEGIAMANGLMDDKASPEDVVVKRLTKNGEVLIKLNLSHISEGKKPNIFLQPNDIIDVRQSPGRRFALGVFDLVKNIFSFTYRVNQ